MNSSTSRIFAFPAQFARRLPDPVFSGMERHIMYVAARDIPQGLPLDPNARLPNLNRQVYREVKDSLLNRDGTEENTFHLKHKGITLVANSVNKRKFRGRDVYDVEMLEGYGILDGGHSYKLLMENLTDVPESQFVKFEILTNVNAEWVPELSAGLNTSVQVQPYSIAELEGLFDWIKDELRDKPYFEKIAWKEGDSGDYTVKDLIGIFSLFHIDHYPHTGNVMHPIAGYSKKAAVHDRFREDQKSGAMTYQKLRPLLHDILVLHDTIRRDGQEPYNKQQRGLYGQLKFVEHSDNSKSEDKNKPKKLFDFPFTGKDGEYRLVNGALYPILGAFRWMVEENPTTGEYQWKGGFESVLKIWENSAGDLINLTRQVSDDVGRNPNALGKSQSNWTNLLNTVARKGLEAQLAATKSS